MPLVTSKELFAKAYQESMPRSFNVDNIVIRKAYLKAPNKPSHRLSSPSQRSPDFIGMDFIRNAMHDP
jgi:hypothetical protein